MNVKEAAKRLNRTPAAVYKAIERKSKLGQIFVYKAGDGYFCLSKDLKRFIK